METAGRRLPQSGAIDLNRLGGSVNRPYPRKNGCSLRAQDRGNAAAGGSGYKRLSFRAKPRNGAAWEAAP